MNTFMGVLALALLGVDRPAKMPPPVIKYEFQVLDMSGVEWREGVFSALQPVARQGTATIWTTTDAVAATLVKGSDHVIAAPKLCSLSEQPGHFAARDIRGLVTNLTRRADGPINHASRVVYTPETERLPNGFSATISGRKLDQGVLVKVALDDTRITAVHSVYLTEYQEPKDAGTNPDHRWEQLRAKLEVPEMTHNEVTGEWLIPRNGVLLVSLGAHSVAGPDGKAVVRERLVLAKAEPLGGSVPPMEQILAQPVVAPAPIAPPMPPPPLPGRALPQATDAQGQPVDLPPLPPEAPAPTTRPDSDEPVATPQTKQPTVSTPKADETGDESKPANPRSKDENSIPVGNDDEVGSADLKGERKDSDEAASYSPPPSRDPSAPIFAIVRDPSVRTVGNLKSSCEVSKNCGDPADCCDEANSLTMSRPPVLRLPVNDVIVEIRVVPRTTQPLSQVHTWRRSEKVATP